MKIENNDYGVGDIPDGVLNVLLSLNIKGCVPFCMYNRHRYVAPKSKIFIELNNGKIHDINNDKNFQLVFGPCPSSGKHIQKKTKSLKYK